MAWQRDFQAESGNNVETGPQWVPAGPDRALLSSKKGMKKCRAVCGWRVL